MLNIRKTFALSTVALVLSSGLAIAAPAAQAEQQPLRHPAASATQGDVTVQSRRDVCFTGACGSATVTSTGKYSAKVSMSVKDTACRDNKKPKIRIQARQYSSTQGTYVHNGPWHNYTKSCGSYQVWNSTFRGQDPLLGMRVQICNGGRCKTSSWM
ncbi:hypothetical protein OH786_37885 (plasmid) [Streptomyces atratus]|jgi:hypothetical protein|uniref:Uncharacterized protein n=1 Tax=Streptomyces atratus TaxID=1893 RepID=A0A1K2F9X5_STRAR|nr:hypothetical protein [Streptomyces atratus]SFY44222.1 hypothetical protein SAMN02787144_104429 [Streptomyces atratus]